MGNNFDKKAEPQSIINNLKINLTKDEIDDTIETMKKGKIPVPEIVHDEYSEVDFKLKSIFKDARLVETKLKQTEDAIISEFIYNQSCFNSKYILSKEQVTEVFKFYLKYAAVVNDLEYHKLPNIIKRKIKSTIWKLKRRKVYKQQFGE